MYKHKMIILIIGCSGLILSGCASNPLRNTPSFMAPSINKLSKKGVYGINYQYPHLKTSKIAKAQINAVNKKYPLKKTLNSVETTKQMLIDKYKTAPIMPQQFQNQLNQLQKENKLTPTQIQNYQTALKQIQPDTNQIGVAAIKLNKKFKNTYLNKSNLQLIHQQLSNASNFTTSELHKLFEYVKPKS